MVSRDLKFVYGPVPSRRLGRSLGVDPIPLKTCNWNCVYCQLGRSSPMTNDRCSYFLTREILAQVADALKVHRREGIDWITFVGSGETTLHAGIGVMIRRVKALSDIPVAVITNGSLLFRPDVRQDLLAADAVLSSIDAGSEYLHRRMNRPFPGLTLKRHVDGLAEFRRVYGGKLWIEVMLVKDLNDSGLELKRLTTAMKRIQPDEVHISLPVRPPAEPWVEPADEDGVMRATAMFGEMANLIHPVQGEFDLSGYDNVIDAVVGVITRHPMREEELVRTLESWAPDLVSKTLADLAASGRAQVVDRYGQRFWSAAEARYADRPASEHYRTVSN